MNISKMIRRLISYSVTMVFVASVFCLPGTVALADEGDNVTDNVTALFNEDDTREGTPVPPGQMVRRGVSGPIVEVGDGYFVIETNFGLVKVYTAGEVDESMIGQRVAVKLEKTDRTAGVNNGTGTGDNVTTSNVTASQNRFYREVDAEQFKLIPSRSTKEHRWGTVEETEAGCFFVDGDGNEIPTECTESDEDVIGLVSTESGNTSDGQPVFFGTEKTSKIQTRIQQRLAKAEEEGDEKVTKRLRDQLDRYEEKQVERQEKKEVRIKVRAEKSQAVKQDRSNSSNKDDKGNSGGN